MDLDINLDKTMDQNLLFILELLEKIEPYYVFSIISIGLVGNTLSFLLFSLTKLRKNPANIILIALSVVDNWFLFALAMVSLRFFENDFNLVEKSEYVCKLTAFSTFVSSFLSIWFVIGYSIQRFIVVYFPFRRHDFCNKSRTKFLIIFLTVFSFFFYSITLITTGFESKYGKSCVTLDEWIDLVKKFTLLDTIQTIIVPFLFISVLNLSIGYKMVQKFKDVAEKTQTSNAHKRDGIEHDPSNNLTKHNLVTRKNSTSAHNKEAINLLLIISVFLVLNFPITINKTVGFFEKNSAQFDETISDQIVLIKNENSTNQTYNVPFVLGKKFENSTIQFMTPEMKAFQINEIFSKISSFIYYINYSVNFFLYTYRTKQFRENFFKIFKK